MTLQMQGWFIIHLPLYFNLLETFFTILSQGLLSMISGAIGARLATDAVNVKSLVGDQLALVVQNIATVIAGLIIAFTANWILAIIILVVAPLMFAQGYLQGKFMKGFSADAKVSIQNISFLLDAILDLKSLKIM